MQTDPGTEREVNQTPHTSPARIVAATSLRRLGNALVSHQPDDALLERLTAHVDDLVAEIESSPERPHAFLRPGPSVFETPTPEGPPTAPRDAFPDCVISGRANPMGVDARLWREGEEAVCNVTLGAAFEGAPGRAHGGIVAALIDETMGLVLSISGTPGFTGRLTVTYRAPTPLGEPLEVRARMTGRDGRKMTITGELKTGDRLLAQAEGLFIAVDTERFLSAGG
jgi:acyl-coenzyme A thioesterase PaaI-like protein